MIKTYMYMYIIFANMQLENIWPSMWRDTAQNWPIENINGGVFGEVMQPSEILEKGEIFISH